MATSNLIYLPMLLHDPLKNFQAFYVAQPVGNCCGILGSIVLALP